MSEISFSQDLQYLAIFSLVLILPKIIARFQIPSGITALGIGLVAGSFNPEIEKDQLFRFLSQIGITSLFVFAGLEVDFKELKRDRPYLLKFVLKSLIILSAVTYGLNYFFNLGLQNSLILSLGIFTPSAGFILNSLHSFKIGHEQEYWVKSKAISNEFISIILLFIAMQIQNVKSLALSLVFFCALFFFLPKIFRFFLKFISPYAPNSEIPLLVVLSLISGVISKELGAYYLIGAFIVGIIGSQFKSDIFKEDEESFFKALSGFFNVFLPFYFFYAGLKISFSGFNLESITLGCLFLIIFIPLRLGSVSSSINFLLHSFKKSPYSISLALLPTLIFGLVIAGILKDKGGVPSHFIYALIFYTLVSSLLPSILFPLQKRQQAKTGQNTDDAML